MMSPLLSFFFFFFFRCDLYDGGCCRNCPSNRWLLYVGAICLDSIFTLEAFLYGNYAFGSDEIHI